MKPARNEPCPCGSGKKFKKCHYLTNHEAERQSAIALSERMKAEAAAERAARAQCTELRGRKPNTLALAALLGMAVAIKDR